MNKPVWQVSPLLLYHIDLSCVNLIGRGIGIQKYHKLYNSNDYNINLTKNILVNADRKFIYSHLLDIEVPPDLPEKF